MGDSKRILAISMGYGAAAEAGAVWENGILLFTHIKRVAEDPEFWIPELLEDIQKKLASGDWVVLVDDKTSSFSGDVIAYDFDALGAFGRTNMQNALDWYVALQTRRAVEFDEAARHFELRIDSANGIVSTTNDEKGRLLYKIDFSQFTPGHRAMLMCVAGATMEEPLSERWMKKFLGVPRPKKSPPMFPAIRVMRELDAARQVNFEIATAEMEERKHVQH